MWSIEVIWHIDFENDTEKMVDLVNENNIFMELGWGVDEGSSCRVGDVSQRSGRNIDLLIQCPRSDE